MDRLQRETDLTFPSPEEYPALDEGEMEGIVGAFIAYRGELSVTEQEVRHVLDVAHNWRLANECLDLAVDGEIEIELGDGGELVFHRAGGSADE